MRHCGTRKGPEDDGKVEMESISSRLGRTTDRDHGSLQIIRGQGPDQRLHLLFLKK